jgi:hypothetical protein
LGEEFSKKPFFLKKICGCIYVMDELETSVESKLIEWSKAILESVDGTPPRLDESLFKRFCIKLADKLTYIAPGVLSRNDSGGHFADEVT